MEPSILERAQHPISRRDIDANVLKVLYCLINANHVACSGSAVKRYVDLMMGTAGRRISMSRLRHILTKFVNCSAIRGLLAAVFGWSTSSSVRRISRSPLSASGAKISSTTTTR